MSEFINWSILGSYSGALGMVLLLTQLTKNMPIVSKMPTQLWSYILSFVVLICAMAFTSELTIDATFQTIFNAAIISTASNGGFSALVRVVDYLAVND